MRHHRSFHRNIQYIEILLCKYWYIELYILQLNIFIEISSLNVNAQNFEL